MGLDDLDLEPKEQAFVTEDATNIVMQLEEWFTARRDHLIGIAKSKADQIQIGEHVITDPEFIRGFQFGLMFSTDFFKELPISVDGGD